MVKLLYTWEIEQLILVIKKYFNENFKSYGFIASGIGGRGADWGVGFKNDKKDIIVKFIGDSGGIFEVVIYKGDSSYPLSIFDSSINEKSASNNENIVYQLNVLKQFLGAEEDM